MSASFAASAAAAAVFAGEDVALANLPGEDFPEEFLLLSSPGFSFSAPDVSLSVTFSVGAACKQKDEEF